MVRGGSSFDHAAGGARVRVWLRFIYGDGQATLRFSRAQLGTRLGYFERLSGWSWKLSLARNPLTEAVLKMVPGGGIEPSTST